MRARRAPLLESCLSILQSESATSDVIELVAEIIIAEVKANDRVYRSKPSASREQFMDGLEVYEVVVANVQAACSRYLADPERERSLLVAELQRSHTAIKGIMPDA